MVGAGGVIDKLHNIANVHREIKEAASTIDGPVTIPIAIDIDTYIRAVPTITP